MRALYFSILVAALSIAVSAQEPRRSDLEPATFELRRVNPDLPYGGFAVDVDLAAGRPDYTGLFSRESGRTKSERHLVQSISLTWAEGHRSTWTMAVSHTGFTFDESIVGGGARKTKVRLHSFMASLRVRYYFGGE